MQHAAPTADRPRLAVAASLLLAALCCCNPAAAQVQSAAALYKGADVALGDKLIAEHRCSDCHSRRFGGDGSAIYRPQGRINTPGFLRGMVEQCNMELKLSLFPEEVTAIAAAINRDHYKFK